MLCWAWLVLDLVIKLLVHRVPACAWTEQGLEGPACVIVSKHWCPRHWKGFDLPSLLCLAAREAGRYLHLPPVRAHSREAHSLHPGSQEPEEDGCWGPLRWVLLRSSLPLAFWGLSAPFWGRTLGPPVWQSLGKPPVLPHALEEVQSLAGGVRGDKHGIHPRLGPHGSSRTRMLQDLCGESAPLPFAPGPAP